MASSVILGVVRRWSYPVTMLALALVVAGCSSGGGKQSAPTTVSRRTTATRGGVTGHRGGGHGFAPLPPLLAILGPCPNTYPSVPLTKLNAGAAGLGRKLVPISASKVRICRWGACDIYTNGGEAARTVPDTLVASVTLSSSGASMFEDLTNRQPRRTTGPMGCTGPDGGIGYEYLLLTFANGSSHVNVEETDGPCVGPQLSNGTLLALPSAAWLNDLRRRTTPLGATGPQI